MMSSKGGSFMLGQAADSGHANGLSWLSETAVQVVGDLWPESAGLDFEDETESLAVLCPDGEQPWQTSSSLSLVADSPQQFYWTQDVATSPATSEISSLSSSPSSTYSPLQEPGSPELHTEPDQLQTLVDDFLNQETTSQNDATGSWPISEQAATSQAAATVIEDEHAQMIDIGLQDLLTLESMCGITSAETAPSPDGQHGLSEHQHGILSSSTSSMRAMVATEPRVAIPVKENKLTTIPNRDVSAQHFFTTPEPDIKPEALAIKQEPMEDDIQILDEVPAKKPAVYVTPQVRMLAPSSVSTSAPAQIVIVLSEQQVQNIQKSGQLVLNTSGISAVVSKPQQQMVKLQTAKTTQKIQLKSGGTHQQQKRKVAAVQGRVRPVCVEVPGPVKATKRQMTASPTTATAAAAAGKKKRLVSAVKAAAGAASWSLPSNAGASPVSLDWSVPGRPSSSLSAEHAQTSGTGEIPDDLQDLLLEGAAVDSPISADADSILEDLICGSVAAHQPLFGSDAAPSGHLSAPSPADSDSADLISACSPCPSDLLSPAASDCAPQSSPDSPGLRRGSTGSAEPWSPSSEPAAWSQRGHRQRPKPYERSGGNGGGSRRAPALTEEERRQRKKEQNKNAAIRYRQKKREEMESVSSDQQQLESRNKQLRGRVSSLTQELGYLRGLMREVLKHRTAAS